MPEDDRVSQALALFEGLKETVVELKQDQKADRENQKAVNEKQAEWNEATRQEIHDLDTARIEDKGAIMVTLTEMRSDVKTLIKPKATALQWFSALTPYAFLVGALIVFFIVAQSNGIKAASAASGLGGGP